jgi:hypothetical protein
MIRTLPAICVAGLPAGQAGVELPFETIYFA